MRKARPGTLATSEHGRYIYAYCHIRTKQVVYSLSQTLNSNTALKQLPDTGANTIPTHIRKDLWKPLYTLSLPTAHPHTLAQGLHAFKKLREYRKLHELCWTPSPLLSKPYTDAQIAHEKAKLEERGGSKKESVYDVIKRRKRHMRVKGVMDQKANSVADLAAVLLEQEEMGVKAAEERAKEERESREKEVKEMLELARSAEDGGLETLEQQAEAMKARMESEEEDPEGLSKTKLRREWYRLNARRMRMQFAANAVADAKDPARRRGMQAERLQEEEKKAELKRQEQLPEPAFLNRSQFHRARELRRLAREAESGGFGKLDTKMAQLQASPIDSLRGTNEVGVDGIRARLHGLKLRKRQMQLAYETSQEPTYSGDMMAEADHLRVKLYEYKVELAEEETREAEEQGFSVERLEALRSAGEMAERQLRSLRATGGLSEEGEGGQESVDATDEPMLTLDGRPASSSSASTPSAPAPGTSSPATTPTEATTAESDPSTIDYASLLPSFPARETSNVPKRGPLRQRLRRANSPIFTTQGIAIKWHDVLDAEYAEMWPENVRHERMGWSRYVAPHAEAKAIGGIGEWRAGQWAGRRANWLPAPEEGEDVGVERERMGFERQRRRGILESVKGEVLRRVREMEAARKRERFGQLPEEEGREESVSV